MSSTAISVSKGCFVFKNGYDHSRNQRQKKKRTQPIPLFEQQFDSELWYDAFKESWQQIESQIEELHKSTYNRILSDLVNYVKECYGDHSVFYDEIIPCATLLTGINQPDHLVQFTALKNQLMSEVTSHVALIYSQDANSVKQMIENMVMQFINADSDNVDSDDAMGSPEKGDHKTLKVKKSQCNMATLSAWLKREGGITSHKRGLQSSPTKKRKPVNTSNLLVVIIPDFESFNCETLQDFIMILSGYTSKLPFVLVFGVATCVSALHRSFPYRVSSRLLLQVFQSHSSTVYLNQILEKIFLNEKCPFHLSGKAFKLLMDVFLFYDFSVTGFTQSMKFCMMEHYYNNKINVLCCPREKIHSTISQLSKHDLEAVRHLPSFRPYVESKNASTRVDLLTSDEYLKKDLTKALEDVHNYLHDFHVTLKILLSLVGNLPNAPLGKQIRELYIACISSNITDSAEYKQCILLLGFQSKEEFLDTVDKIILLLGSTISHEYTITDTPRKRSLPYKKSRNSDSTSNLMSENLTAIKAKLVDFKTLLENAGLESQEIIDKENVVDIIEKLSRQNLKEQLLKVSGKDKPMSQFAFVRGELLKYLTEEVFCKLLRPPSTQPFHELFFFDDVFKVKRHIVGTPRASIHTALNNPWAYLQCKCCELSSQEMILPTLPDLSIAYKLHLECGKLINLYDWLQAFLTVVDPVENNEDDDEERREVDPEIQARFTRAVSELQFLGFIKTSKRKTDHVSRLTW